MSNILMRSTKDEFLQSFLPFHPVVSEKKVLKQESKDKYKLLTITPMVILEEKKLLILIKYKTWVVY